MRPLTLHVSALSDAEYDFYTTSLRDLAADSTDSNNHISSTTHARNECRYERMDVGVREARAWLRGRYADLPASDIDAILKLFCPNMLPSDTLTGGQFFVALRLAIHAKSGKGVDRTLAFVQASPYVEKAPDSLTLPKRPVQAPPSHPDRQKAPLTTATSPDTNPFTRKSMEHAAPPDSQAPVFPYPHPRGKLSQNPFLACDKPESAPASPMSPPNHGKLPPLPPRKPTTLATPARRPSEAAPSPITSTAHFITPPGPPLVPIKPTHVMSPLMRQSLEASKHAQSMKRAEEQLDRERVLQVLKTTSSSSSVSNVTPDTRTRSLSPTKQYPAKPANGYGNGNGHGHGTGSAGSDDATYVPPLPRRKPSLPSSTSSSILSLDQVASAKLPSPISPPFRPPLPNRDPHARALSISTIYTDPIPPPKHPHRGPPTSTDPPVNDTQSSPPPSPRVARSKSVTAASSSSALPPPPRRKRPESMQLHTPTSDRDLPTLPAHAHAPTHLRTTSLHGLSRHLSLTRERDSNFNSNPNPTHSDPISNIQRTLTQFQLKAQPKLDAVRYKAEAGISKRGYLHHTQLGGARWREEGEEGLMTDTRWAAAHVDPDSAPTTDEEPSSAEDPGPRKTTGGASHRHVLTESDNLKWPMGEGWKPL